MRLILFEVSGTLSSLLLDKVLHVLNGPGVFELPLMRRCFAGGVLYQGQFVPLLEGGCSETPEDEAGQRPACVLVCEAEFGLIGVPADRILRITKTGEIDSEVVSGCGSQHQTFEINRCEYRLLDLNLVVEDPDFTFSGLKV